MRVSVRPYSEFYFGRLFNDFYNILVLATLLITGDGLATKNTLERLSHTTNHGICGTAY